MKALIFSSLLATTAVGAVLTDTVEKLRENALSIEQVGSVDVIKTAEGGTTEEYGICHIPTILWVPILYYYNIWFMHAVVL